MKPNLVCQVMTAWWPLKRGDNNVKTLVGKGKSWPLSLNRGLISYSFQQLFRDFDYWPLSGGPTVYE